MFRRVIKEWFPPPLKLRGTNPSEPLAQRGYAFPPPLKHKGTNPMTQKRTAHNLFPPPLKPKGTNPAWRYLIDSNRNINP